MKKLLLLVSLLILPNLAEAQSAPNVGPNDSFAWFQDGPTLATVQAYVYKYYLDGAVTGSVFSGVTCTGTATPYSCQVRSPTFAMGAHGITLTAASAAGESAQSTPFQFVYGNPPQIPNNIRIIKAVP